MNFLGCLCVVLENVFLLEKGSFRLIQPLNILMGYLQETH